MPGFAVSSTIGSPDAAQPAVLALTLPLSFISGVYIPWTQLPSALQHVAQAFPLRHLVAALGRGFFPGTHGVAWGDLAILAAWGRSWADRRAGAVPLDPSRNQSLTRHQLIHERRQGVTVRTHLASRTPPNMKETHDGDDRKRDPYLSGKPSHTREGAGRKGRPKIKFPFVITGVARGFAALRPYRCPECGAKVT